MQTLIPRDVTADVPHLVSERSNFWGCIFVTFPERLPAILVNVTGSFPRLVWILVAIQFLASSVVVVTAISSSGGQVSEILSALAWGFLPTVLVLVGALIVARQPRNTVGWLLMIPALSGLIEKLMTVGVEGLEHPPEVITSGWVVALAFNNFSWVFLIFPVFHLLLVFPNGQLLSRRWRSVVGLEILMVSTMIILGFFVSEIGPIDGPWTVANPIGFLPAGVVDGIFPFAWAAGLLVVTISGVVSIVLRYRNSVAVERQQIKWLLFAVALFGIIYPSAAQFETVDGGAFDLVLALSLNSIAIAIAIAVLKYRLFEIDRVISRTVGYALVIGVLALVYAVGAVWLPSILSGESPLFVALATLTAAALFNPLRRRILHGVDRRFYRARYDSERVVEEFKAQLRDQTDVDALARDWVSVVSATMNPSALGLWVKQG